MLRNGSMLLRLALCGVLACAALQFAAAQRLSEIEGLVPSEDGASYWLEHQGKRWQVRPSAPGAEQLARSVADGHACLARF